MEADMDKALGVDKLLGWISDGLMFGANTCAPWAGFVLGVSLFALLHVPDGKTKTQKFWLFMVGVSALTGPVAYLFLPKLINWLAHSNVYMPKWHFVTHTGGFIVGGIIYFWLVRKFQPWLNEISHKLTKRTSLERNRRTDVRDINKHLPAEEKKYDPMIYIQDDPKKGKGLFLGLDEKSSPIYISYEKWRKSHVQVIQCAVKPCPSGRGYKARFFN